MRSFALVLTAALLFVAAPAYAQVQTNGPQVFNGRFEASVAPIGFQVGFGNRDVGGYKLITDFAGKLALMPFGGLWLGGGLNYTAGFYNCYVTDCGGDLQLWAFVQLTFEKLIPIPLVPWVRAGLGGDILFYGDTAGAFIFRFGGGADYWLLKWLGLGIQTNFTMGPGFYPNGVGTHFYGTWDFGIGARFAF